MDTETPNSNNSITTRQKIVICALDLFATKGYTETSVRDIALAVGIKAASLYNHFPSKEDLLQHILNDFYHRAQDIFDNPQMPSILQKNPTAEGILQCMPLSLSILEDKYYSKVLHLIFQEQHRNMVVRNYVAKTTQIAEEYVEKFFNELKKLNVIRHDADPDFWKKIASSILYTFPNRSMLGIGEEASDFTGMNLAGLLYFMYDTILKIYGIANNQDP